MQALCIRIGFESIQQTRLLIASDLDILLQGLNVADRSHLSSVGGLSRVQRSLKATNIVQDCFILRDRNVLRLLTGRNSTLLNRSSVGTTLGSQLHELLEGLRE
jgi:hypothetical protein